MSPIHPIAGMDPRKKGDPPRRLKDHGDNRLSAAPEAQPALKEIFNRRRLRHIAEETRAVYPAFDAARFLAMVSDGLDNLSIMQRSSAQAKETNRPAGCGRHTPLRELAHQSASIARRSRCETPVRKPLTTSRFPCESPH
jgi:hypothetical protein